MGSSGRNVRLTIGLAIAALVATACGGAQSRTERKLESGGAVMLWCQEKTGKECARAEAALEVGALPTEKVPDVLLTAIVDQEEDCDDPGIGEILRLVGNALGVNPSNWHDNAGSHVDRADIGKTFAGGGCTNCCWEDSEPPVKVHYVENGGKRLYLVRVWERVRPVYE